MVVAAIGLRDSQISLPARDRIVSVEDTVLSVGTRTYSRVDWAFQQVSGSGKSPEIYHCYHMCRDLAADLNLAGHQAWSVMGVNERNGFKQLHPMVIVATQSGPQLFDPAFGILKGIPIDGQVHKTEDGKYQVESKGDAILLRNLKNDKNFLYFWNPDMESFHTNDHYLVRRNNWGGDEYTMTYAYTPEGAISANVTLFHKTREDANKGQILIMERGSGALVSRAFTHDEVLGCAENYGRCLGVACATLGIEEAALHDKLDFLLRHIPDIRESQRQAFESELRRQASGVPLW